MSTALVGITVACVIGYGRDDVQGPGSLIWTTLPAVGPSRCIAAIAAGARLNVESICKECRYISASRDPSTLNPLEPNAMKIWTYFVLRKWGGLWLAWPDHLKF